MQKIVGFQKKENAILSFRTLYGGAIQILSNRVRGRHVKKSRQGLGSRLRPNIQYVTSQPQDWTGLYEIISRAYLDSLIS